MQSLHNAFVINSSKFLIKPHFLDADKSLLVNIEGLNPNRTLHDVFVNFEPVTMTQMLINEILEIIYE